MESIFRDSRRWRIMHSRLKHFQAIARNGRRHRENGHKSGLGKAGLE